MPNDGLILNEENQRLNRKIFAPKVYHLCYNFLEAIHKKEKRNVQDQTHLNYTRNTAQNSLHTFNLKIKFLV